MAFADTRLVAAKRLALADDRIWLWLTDEERRRYVRRADLIIPEPHQVDEPAVPYWSVLHGVYFILDDALVGTGKFVAATLTYIDVIPDDLGSFLVFGSLDRLRYATDTGRPLPMVKDDSEDRYSDTRVIAADLIEARRIPKWMGRFWRNQFHPERVIHDSAVATLSPRML